MATDALLTEYIKNNLYSAVHNERDWVGTIDSAYTADATSLSVPDADDYSLQDILEFPEGDQYLVTGINTGTNTLTVIPGWDGTTSENHSSGDWFTKNPRFSIASIQRAIDGTILELRGHGIHVWGEGTITLVSGTDIYDLSETDIIEELGGVAGLFYEEPNYDAPTGLPFRFFKNHSSNSAQGYSLYAWDPGVMGPGDTLYYIYFKEITAASDLLTRQDDLVVLGATARLLASTMGPRTHEPGNYDDRTIQPGQGGRDSNWYRGEYKLALLREAALLKTEAQNFPGTPRTRRASRWRS